MTVDSVFFYSSLRVSDGQGLLSTLEATFSADFGLLLILPVEINGNLGQSMILMIDWY